MRSASIPGTFVVARLELFGESFSCEDPILARNLVTFSETLLKDRAIRLALQRVRKLQEQATISDDMVARFQSAGNLRSPIQAFPERHRASAKLVRRCRGINKRLVLAIAKNGCIRKRNGVGDRARIHSRHYVHVFL